MKWITSEKRKRHQRAINRLVRNFNKGIEADDLWCGRFIVRQEDSPSWIRYEDGSGGELWVTLKFIDRATGRYYKRFYSVNGWCVFGGSRIWELMNWLIIDHWKIWSEDLSKDKAVWREYNKNTRKV